MRFERLSGQLPLGSVVCYDWTGTHVQLLVIGHPLDTDCLMMWVLPNQPAWEVETVGTWKTRYFHTHSPE